MKIGYVRVSTEEQNEARQIEQMKKNEVEKIFMEKVSGKDITGREELQKMLDFAREGDTIYIHDFSRLARSTKDLLDIVELLKQKNVDLISFKENIDTSTSVGKFMLTMIGALNEFERVNMLERQREGIIIAQREGKFRGRKTITLPENWDAIYKAWKKRELTAKQAMKILGLKKDIFYKFAKMELGKLKQDSS